MKTCPKCGETKPWDAYSVDRSKANGHVAKCKVCVAAADKARNAAIPETQREERNAARRARYATDPTYAAKLRQAVMAHAAEPAVAEKKRRAAEAWRRANPEWHRENARAWQRDNPGKAAAIGAKKRATKGRAVPRWVDHEKINAIYAEARAMRDLGIDVQVDHIVPLQGRTVSGLHVHYNLRLLLASDNAAKGNHHWPDMP